MATIKRITLRWAAAHPVYLGRRGENLARTIEIDATPMAEEFPGCTFALLAQRPTEVTAYAATVTEADGIVSWPITDVDTGIAGSGRIELRAMLGDVVAKSVTMATVTDKSLDAPTDTDPPEPEHGWLDQALVAAAAAKKSAEGAAASDASAAESAAAAKKAQTDATHSADKAELAANTAAQISAEIENLVENAEHSATAAETSAAAASDSAALAESAQIAAEAAEANAKLHETGAETSANSAEVAAASAEAAQGAVDEMIDTIAKEPTARQILAVMQQELTLLNQLVESGMGNKDSLNGFSFSRGENDELIISYVNPDDETDVAMSTFATKATANLIAQELAAINESLHTIVGAERTTTTTNTEG